MDVRCERCKTEYEFDDARITEAGVTVKCTTCSHVFKVKKKALVVTVPVKPDEAADAVAPPEAPAPAAAPVAPSPSPSPAAAAPAAEKPREWKVRQANGNVFTFKELTTLQKWIVERKVARDDEISLTGESWKRLGNIAELASFFQVVEEAQKAQQLTALQSGGYLAYNPPSGSFPMPTVPPQPAPAPPAPAPHPVAAPIELTAVAPPSPPPPKRAPTPPPEPLSAPPPPAAPRGRAVMSAQRRPSDEDEDELRAAGIKRGGGGGKWLVIVLLLALAAGAGWYGYTTYYLPMEEQKAASAKAADEERARKEREAQEQAQRDKEALAAAQEKERLAAAAAAAAVVVVDAGAPATPDAGQPVVDAGQPAAEVKREPVRNFDWYMMQGDRLRDREKPEAALDMYGKAADLKPDRAEPIAGRGLALLDMGQKIQAEASFQEALKANPRYGVAIMGLAETYRALGRKADAIKYYERYLDVLPNGPEAPVATEAIRRLKAD